MLPENRSTSSCRVCREPIRVAATKCIKCGSYQDWTRHLLRWSTLLGSLFVLSQVWSISTSLSQLAFSSKSAKLSAAITRCNLDEVRIAYENSGELSAIVTGVDFAVRKNGERISLDVAVRSSHADEDLLVSPKALPISSVYRPYIDNTPANFISAAQQGQDCAYLIDIEWIDFSGTQQQLLRECRCP